MSIRSTIALLSLLLTPLAVLGQDAANKETPIEPQIAGRLATTLMHQPALFSSADEAQWKEGEGPFKGLKVIIVGEDKKTGATAAFVKVPPGHPRDTHHKHPTASHTLVLAGTINVSVEGRNVTLRPGDYFRTPAGWTHTGSEPQATEGATLFMLTEGDFREIKPDHTARR